MKRLWLWICLASIVCGIAVFLFALRVVVTPHGQFHRINELPIDTPSLSGLPVIGVGFWRKSDFIGHGIQMSGKLDLTQLLGLCRTNKSFGAMEGVSTGPTEGLVIGPDGTGSKRIIAEPNIPVWYIQAWDRFVHLRLTVNGQTGEYSGAISRTRERVAIRSGVQSLEK